MNTAEEDLKNFTQFVHQRAEGQSKLHLADLFELWMFENGPDQYDENVAAINASITDYMNGERGTPAGEHSQALREEFGINSK